VELAEARKTQRLNIAAYHGTIAGIGIDTTDSLMIC